MPTRKFYAIKRPEKGKGKKKKERMVVLDSSSDTEDDFMPIPKTKKKLYHDGIALLKEELQALRQEIHRVGNEVHSICADVQHMRCIDRRMKVPYAIDRRMKVPYALHRQLTDTFKCSICCQSPTTPPVIFGRCCKSIIGCQSCVDEWYRGEDGMEKNCPLCGSERALPETMRVHRLDDFLLAIEPLISGAEDATD